LTPFLRAQDPPADGHPPADTSGLFTTDASPTGPIGPRIGIEQEFGDGVGWQHGFTRIDSFIPVFQIPLQSVLFADLTRGNVR
jgi:hypothetical protein